MKSSTSLPTITATEGTRRGGITTSASFPVLESGAFHLSASNPSKRFRSLKHPPVIYEDEEQSTPAPSQRFGRYTAPLKWIATVYCCFSIFYFPYSVFGKRRLDALHVELNAASGVLQPLSRLASIVPSPVAFYPHFWSPDVSNSETTACVWTMDDELHQFPEWASKWSGPISLLVVTSNNTVPETLVRNIRFPRAVVPRLSVHILHIVPGTREHPNAYINLARLFAPTSRVVLFPGPLTTSPLSDNLNTVHTIKESETITFLTTTRNERFRRMPLLPSLAPIVMSKTHPLWCTERFFYVPSRANDWEECLWQLWMESFGSGAFGKAMVVQVPGWEHEEPVTSVLDAKLRTRLAGRWRLELCDLAVKQVTAIAAAEVITKRKVHWLKEFCSQVY